MRRDRRGFLWQNGFWGRGGRREFAERPAAGGEPGAALVDTIAAHERLVGYLVAATAAERAVLQELYQSAALDQPIGVPAPAVAGGAHGRTAEVPADFEARLFGSFEVRYRGKVLAPWPSHRAASLLKFLLLYHGRTVRREVLMDAFWPGSSPKSARNN